MDALAASHDAGVEIIDTSIVRVYHNGACISRNKRQSTGRLRGGLTSKVHVLVDGNTLPVRLALIAGEAHDNRLAAKLLSHLKSGAMLLAARIRCWLDQGSRRPIWRLGENPTATEPERRTLLQAVSLSRPQPDRAVRQSNQAVSMTGFNCRARAAAAPATIDVPFVRCAAFERCRAPGADLLEHRANRPRRPAAARASLRRRRRRSPRPHALRAAFLWPRSRLLRCSG
jgi:hypothetical protein